MIRAEDAVVWVGHSRDDDDCRPVVVMVRSHEWGVPEDRQNGNRYFWCDPIGAAYSAWRDMSNAQRLGLMLETAIDLAMQGASLKDVLVAFCEVPEFKALGGQSYPMCRALTSALIGKCLEANTMSFEELLRHYAKQPCR